MKSLRSSFKNIFQWETIIQVVKLYLLNGLNKLDLIFLEYFYFITIKNKPLFSLSEM